MELQDYTDKSIVIYGSTKPYRDELKALGGRFNPNLDGGAGWIFRKVDEEKVKRFIDEKTNSVSSNRQKPDLSNNEKNESPKSPLFYKKPIPASQLESSAVGLKFPNNFIAGDGLQYQIIVYTCPRPSLGQKVSIKVGDETIDYTVTRIKSYNPTDDIEITPVVNDTSEPAISRAVIMNG